jgi:2-oxoglutarate ferredoxin oxidoreductase subunit beta
MSCTCSIKDYFSDNLYTWCTNCGNYGIHAGVKRALVAECKEPKDVLLCFDIGCNGNGSDKIDGYRAHGLHGRVLPFACGASVANRRVTVMAFAGDGGTLGEGINHLVHAIRGNYNVTFILHNNLNYGLTQGQASSTTKPGMKMNSSPDGITSDPIHPMRFVMSLEPGFVARSFSGDVHHITKTIQAGLRHPGFSFIEILQNCPTYNKATPHQWYQERVYDVSDSADGRSLDEARQIAEDLENKIAIGVLYKDDNRKPFMDRQANRQGFTTELVDEVRSGENIKELLESFK